MENALVDFVKFHVQEINVTNLLANRKLEFKGEFTESQEKCMITKWLHNITAVK